MIAELAEKLGQRVDAIRASGWVVCSLLRLAPGARPNLVTLVAATALLASAGVHADSALHQAIGAALHNIEGDPGQVPDGPFNDRSHTCIGKNTVDTLGEERVQELGITQGRAAEVLGTLPLTRQGLTEAEIDALLDAIDQCIPFQEIWVFLAINTRNTGKLIKTEAQREALSACLAETPGRRAVRDVWRVLFTQSNEAFQAAFAQRNEESMACYAEVFCGPAYVGSVITPGLFQTMITEGACPF